MAFRKLIFSKKNKKIEDDYFDYPLSEITSFTNIRTLTEEAAKEFPDMNPFDVRVACNKMATLLSRITASQS